MILSFLSPSPFGEGLYSYLSNSNFNFKKVKALFFLLGHILHLRKDNLGNFNIIYNEATSQNYIFTSMSHGSVGIVQKIEFEIRPD